MLKLKLRITKRFEQDHTGIEKQNRICSSYITPHSFSGSPCLYHLLFCHLVTIWGKNALKISKIFCFSCLDFHHIADYSISGNISLIFNLHAYSVSRDIWTIITSCGESIYELFFEVST